MLTEVKHLVVLSPFRKIGLGKHLIACAVAEADTPILYATIRDKNKASLRLFQSAGFHIASTAQMKDHKTHFLIKNNESITKVRAGSEVELLRLQSEGGGPGTCGPA